MNNIVDNLAHELSCIWAMHHAVGLDGSMCLYTIEEQDPWRAKEPGLVYWFDHAGTQEAIQHVISYYNEGNLPNTSLLLNPVIHTVQDGQYTPMGSGFAWMTAFALGIAELHDEQLQRLQDKGVICGLFHRGDNERAGIKAVLPSSTALNITDNPMVVEGCEDMYSLSDIKSDAYAPYYVLSGLNYLSLHGIFIHPDFSKIISDATDIDAHKHDVQEVIDANQCWLAYDKLHRLYTHFGQDVGDIDHNNRFFNLCGRDLALFDRTGPMRIGSDETFRFTVPGLIPRGAVTLLAAPGGTGKSSVAHQLCVQASIDYSDADDAPVWLGQQINKEVCDGICVYFSGEDGPAIINARGKLFDPEGNAQRLQFHRTEFVDKEMTFSDYLLGLRKMPNVSIVVIDPARKYLSGDENDADVVSEFFEAIEEFAIEKNCAMIVVHHLQKGAKPTNAREVLDELRGSQVFIDRPRVVLGMCRDEKHTIVGLSKCNIPPNLGMVTEERVFTRNPENLQLIWLPGEAGIRRDYMTKEEIEALELAQFNAQLAPSDNPA